MSTEPTDTKPLALVTGASRGLGAAMAEALAAKGWHVLALARTTGALEALDDRIKTQGGSATLAPMDITDSGAMAHLCRSIHDRWGHLDLWVHTAVHATALTPAHHIAEKDFDKSLEVNVRALSRLITYVDPLLRGPHAGRAVLFDDETTGDKFHGTYAATKAAQKALVQSWQAEATTPGAPRITLYAAPAMPTGTRARFHPGEDHSRLTDPRQVAAAVLDAMGL